MDQKLNGFCKHGNPALDCVQCNTKRNKTGTQITEKQEDEYFAKKYPVKMKKIFLKHGPQPQLKVCPECKTVYEYYSNKSGYIECNCGQWI